MRRIRKSTTFAKSARILCVERICFGQFAMNNEWINPCVRIMCRLCHLIVLILKRYFKRWWSWTFPKTNRMEIITWESKRKVKNGNPNSKLFIILVNIYGAHNVGCFSFWLGAPHFSIIHLISSGSYDLTAANSRKLVFEIKLFQW